MLTMLMTIRGLKNVFNVGDVADFSPYSGNIFFPKGMGVRGSFGRFPHCYVINVPNIFSMEVYGSSPMLYSNADWRRRRLGNPLW